MKPARSVHSSPSHVVLGVLLLSLFAMPLAAAEEWIFFSSDRAGTFDIWRIRPDGTGLAPVIQSSRNLFFPRVSPDGKKMSYAVNDASGNAVGILDFASSSTTEYPVFFANRHDWAPDMTKIWGSAFTVLSCQEDIDVLDLATGTVTGVLVEPARQSLLGVDWLTGEVYYHSDPCNSPQNVLKAYDPTTTSIRIVKGVDNRSGEDHGDISPDGLYLAYAKSLVGFQDPHRIFRLNSDGSGSELRLSTDTGVGDNDPDISVDGTRVVFQRTMSTSISELWIVGMDGSTETPLLQDSHRNLSPNWELAELGEDVDLSAIEAKVDAIEVKLDELGPEISDLTAAAGDLKAEVVDVRAQQAVIQGQLVDVAGQTSDIRAELVDLKAETADLKAELVALDADSVDAFDFGLEQALLTCSCTPGLYLPAPAGALNRALEVVGDQVDFVETSLDPDVAVRIASARCFVDKAEALSGQGRFKLACMSLGSAVQLLDGHFDYDAKKNSFKVKPKELCLDDSDSDSETETCAGSSDDDSDSG